MLLNKFKRLFYKHTKVFPFGICKALYKSKVTLYLSLIYNKVTPSNLINMNLNSYFLGVSSG